MRKFLQVFAIATVLVASTNALTALAEESDRELVVVNTITPVETQLVQPACFLWTC